MKDKAFDRRLKFVITGFYLMMLLFAFYVAIKYALPLLLPFIIAFLLAMVLQKPLNYLKEKTKISKSIWATVFVLAVIGVVGFLIFLAGSKIYAQLQGLTEYLFAKLQDIPTFLKDAEKTMLELCKILPGKFQEGARDSVGGFFTELLQKYQSDDNSVFNLQEFIQNPPDIAWIKTPLEGVWDTAKRLPFIIVGIVLTIIATIFTASDYDRLVGFIKRQLPEEKRNGLSIAKRTVSGSVGKLLKSYLTIICITFIEMSVSLSLATLLGVYDGGYVLAISLVVAVVDILPVLGTGSIAVPWTIVSLATGKTGLGVWILVTYIIITVFRQYIEPKLIADNLGLPPVLTLMGMYVGVQLFGFVGMFLLPLTLMLVKVLNDKGVFRLWKSAKKKPEGDDTKAAK